MCLVGKEVDGNLGKRKKALDQYNMRPALSLITSQYQADTFLSKSPPRILYYSQICS